MMNGVSRALSVCLLSTILVCCCASAWTLEGLLSGAASAPLRAWTARDAEGSVHCLGNGRLCIYEEGPNIIQVFGPSYSTTTIGRIDLAQEEATCASRRVPGAAIWEHRIMVDGAEAAVVTDFVDSDSPCFLRHVVAASPIEFIYRPEPDLRIADNSDMMQRAGSKGGLLIETPIGKPSVPFGNYPIPFAFFHQFAWRGEVEVLAGARAGEMRFRFRPGTATLFITGGPELEAAMAGMQAVLATDEKALLARTRAWWADFTAQGRDFAAELPADVPGRDRLVQVMDDVAVLIKAQQAAEGGVLAGYPYHLGYVRDQYGTHRGLVALGHEEMSRSILDFYFNVFSEFGAIHNAQAFGIPGLFHVHENDEVEITGYITMQAFDYLARSGDTDFVKYIFPMLEWAWEVQQRHLVQGMLPFNGDETYVAGAILPRTALNDGSAEATMLFIDGGARLRDFAEKNGLWDSARIQQAGGLLESVRGAYRDNFWREGQLITNNPARCAASEGLPRTRHGVCEACITVQWTLRTENGRYLCLNCLNTQPLPRVAPEAYVLQSVSLTPFYFHSSLFAPEELRAQVDTIAGAYRDSGKLPSRPGGEVSVGYDYGLVLYALTELRHPMARTLFEKTLELADTTGAWAEYYRDNKPAGTRCRPWESAINAEALLHWVEVEYGWK